MCTVKKRTEDLVVGVLAIPIIFLSKLFCVVLLIVALYVSGFLAAQVKRNQIRGDIFSYVQENRDNIVLKNPEYFQEFFYAATGIQDGSVEYGYYYTPNDRYIHKGEAYRNGYRMYGIPDDDTDWYYSERICEDWFYYEIHDG